MLQRGRTTATRKRRQGGVATTFPIVCIVMSVGGVPYLKTLFQRLSTTTGMAFIVIHHISKLPTHLPHLISGWTKMPVQLAAKGVPMQPNCVYVLPSGQEIQMTDGTASLMPRSKIKGWTNVGAIFLDSLARSGHPGIAVILSGLDRNGAVALQRLKKSGGIVIAQKPETATSPQMPIAAIETGQVDCVLAPEKIASQLVKIGKHFRRSQKLSI